MGFWPKPSERRRSLTSNMLGLGSIFHEANQHRHEKVCVGTGNILGFVGLLDVEHVELCRES